MVFNDPNEFLVFAHFVKTAKEFHFVDRQATEEFERTSGYHLIGRCRNTYQFIFAELPEKEADDARG